MLKYSLAKNIIIRKQRYENEKSLTKCYFWFYIDLRL